VSVPTYMVSLNREKLQKSAGILCCLKYNIRNTEESILSLNWTHNLELPIITILHDIWSKAKVNTAHSWIFPP